MTRKSLAVVLTAMLATALCGLAHAQKLTTLHSFSGSDGANPLGALVQGADGNFYGTASSGGTGGGGTVYQITPSGTLKTLYNFNGSTGDSPSGLVQANDGNFYGTTYSGGGGLCGGGGCGTIFQITPAGQYSLMWSFSLTDGAFPAYGGTHPSQRPQSVRSDNYWRRKLSGHRLQDFAGRSIPEHSQLLLAKQLC